MSEKTRPRVGVKFNDIGSRRTSTGTRIEVCRPFSLLRCSDLDVPKAHANFSGGFIPRKSGKTQNGFPSRKDGARKRIHNKRHSGVPSGRVYHVPLSISGP
jgi:hypothetical protein